MITQTQCCMESRQVTSPAARWSAATGLLPIAAELVALAEDEWDYTADSLIRIAAETKDGSTVDAFQLGSLLALFDIELTTPALTRLHRSMLRIAGAAATISPANGRLLVTRDAFRASFALFVRTVETHSMALTLLDEDLDKQSHAYSMRRSSLTDDASASGRRGARNLLDGHYEAPAESHAHPRPGRPAGRVQPAVCNLDHSPAPGGNKRHFERIFSEARASIQWIRSGNRAKPQAPTARSPQGLPSLLSGDDCLRLSSSVAMTERRVAVAGSQSQRGHDDRQARRHSHEVNLGNTKAAPARNQTFSNMFPSSPTLQLAGGSHRGGNSSQQSTGRQLVPSTAQMGWSRPSVATKTAPSVLGAGHHRRSLELPSPVGRTHSEAHLRRSSLDVVEARRDVEARNAASSISSYVNQTSRLRACMRAAGLTDAGQGAGPAVTTLDGIIHGPVCTTTTSNGSARGHTQRAAQIRHELPSSTGGQLNQTTGSFSACPTTGLLPWEQQGRRAARRVPIKNVSREDVKHARDIFDSVDEDHDGVVPLRAVLAMVGDCPAARSLRADAMARHQSQDQRFAFADMMQLFYPRLTREEAEILADQDRQRLAAADVDQVRTAFVSMDKDGDGRLSGQDVVRGLQTAGHLSQEVIDNVILTMFVEELTDSVDYVAFKRWYAANVALGRVAFAEHRSPCSVHPAARNPTGKFRPTRESSMQRLRQQAAERYSSGDQAWYPS